MASSRGHSSTPNIQHNSALTALMEGQNKKCITDRLIYVANISPEQVKRDITDRYERVFHNLIKSHLGETISGLLLLYPSCIIHIIESSSEILYAILQDLVEAQQQDANPLLQNSKILTISHNIPSRLFSQWYFRYISLPTVYLEDTMEQPSALSLLGDTLALLLKLGVFLAKILKPGMRGPGENLHTLVPDLLIRESVVCLLIKSKQFLTPQQFLEMYDKPLNFISDSDEVWPVPQHIYM
ncbi:testis-expressed protein 47-like [Discoglossus pictus]